MVVCCHGGPGLWDYLGPLAELLDDACTVIRFDQRGCGRSSGGGPFTIAQAVDDLDRLRAAWGVESCHVLGHSWGAELALRYAARHPARTRGVVYLAGVGADNSYRDPYRAESRRRLGPDLARWQELAARERTPDEEREWCLLQWRPDFSPGPAAAEHALALWNSRPAGTAVNLAANRQLWTDRLTTSLLREAVSVTSPVRMIFGADDPRPWTANDPLLGALPRADRIVIPDAGHSPWSEQPQATRRAILDALIRTISTS
ncbi:proline iminopeptidase [Frankia sp. AiPs1]